jgi:hypothetical protein
MEHSRRLSFTGTASVSLRSSLIITLLMLGLSACGVDDAYVVCPESGIDHRLVGDWLRCDIAESGLWIERNEGMRVERDGSRKTLAVNWHTGRLAVADQACPLPPYLCDSKNTFRYPVRENSWSVCSFTIEGDKLSISGLPRSEGYTQHYQRVNPAARFFQPLPGALGATIDGVVYTAPEVWPEAPVRVQYSGNAFTIRSFGQYEFLIYVEDGRHRFSQLPATFELAGRDGNYARLGSGCATDRVMAETNDSLTGVVTIREFSDDGKGGRRCAGSFEFRATTSTMRVYDVRHGYFDASW